MATVADLTTKQSGNVRAGAPSLDPKRITSVAFQAQAASAEAHTTNVENIIDALLENAYKLRKDKSD
jgi:hypothetical protein